MSSESGPRFPSSYRKKEIDHICQHALSGRSLCYVGVHGVGKSSLAEYLRDYRDCRREDAPHVLFPTVDCSSWDESPDQLWDLMYDAFCSALEPRLQAAPGGMDTIPPPDGSSLQNLLRTLHHCCRVNGCRVMFVLDSFDHTVQAGSPFMLNELNTLQIEGNPEHVSYLLLTQKLLHRLGGLRVEDATTDFHHLFQHSIYALTPFAQSDSRYLLEHLNWRDRSGLPSRDLALIEDLGGGHASLTETIYELWRNGLPASGDVFQYIAKHTDVLQECLQIFKSLHREEQDVALRLARNDVGGADQEVIDHLGRRGLVTYTGQAKWFSRVMDEYLTMLAN